MWAIKNIENEANKGLYIKYLESDLFKLFIFLNVFIKILNIVHTMQKVIGIPKL